MTNDKELKPCPFCGNTKLIVADWRNNPAHETWVSCPECLCSTKTANDESSAIHAWNTRTTPPTDGLRSGDEYQGAMEHIEQLNVLCEDFGCTGGTNRIHWLHEQLSDLSSQAEKLRVMREAIIASNEAFNHMQDLLSDEDATPEEVLVKINCAVTANNAALADKE